MARSFSNADHRLANTANPTYGAAGASVGTMAFTLKPNWAYNDNLAHVFLCDEGGYLTGLKFSDNHVYIGFLYITDHRVNIVADATMFSNGVWANHLFTWDEPNTDTYYYVDGVQKGSQLTSLQTPGPTFAKGLTLGNNSVTSALGNTNLNGTLAEFGVWNRVLNAKERLLVMATGCPLWVPSGLVAYWPLDVGKSPEPSVISGYNLTLSGTGGGPATATHPTIYGPYSKAS